MDAGRGPPLSAREEEVLGLLAGFDDGCCSDRELSFSDLVEAGRAGAEAKPSATTNRHAPAAPHHDGGNTLLSPRKQQKETSGKKDKRPNRQRSGGSRGSCGGSGDGVLLNFYVPGLRLTRSMTAPRPGRGVMPAPKEAPAPAKPAAAAAAAAAGKSRTIQAPLGIGCWPALWPGRGRDRSTRTTANAYI